MSLANMENRRLLLADFVPYYWSPKIWIRKRKYWNEDRRRFVARGLEGRLWLWGFALSFDGAGWFHNGSRWLIAYRYRPELEEMLI